MINKLPEDLYYEINNYLNNCDSKNFETILKNINTNIKFNYEINITTIKTNDFVGIYINNDNSHEYYQSNDTNEIIKNFMKLKFIILYNISVEKILTITKIRNEIQQIILCKNTNMQQNTTNNMQQNTTNNIQLNNTLKSIEFNFINYPLLNNKFITYYNNNNINKIYNYNSKGLLHKNCITYYENKNIKYIDNYKNGLLDDYQYCYYEDGKTLQKKEKYDNGLKTSKWYEYYDTNNLTLKSITNYNKDLKDDIQLYYHENKNLYRQEKYKNGELIYTLTIPYNDVIISKIQIDID
jgi:antitoxin component YwqK of YwqJK toxin-antitoxin module